jgi:hypothetical protein
MSPVMFNVQDDIKLSQGQSPNETPSAFCNNFSAQKDNSMDEDEMSPLVFTAEDNNKLSQGQSPNTMASPTKSCTDVLDDHNYSSEQSTFNNSGSTISSQNIEKAFENKIGFDKLKKIFENFKSLFSDVLNFSFENNPLSVKEFHCLYTSILKCKKS